MPHDKKVGMHGVERKRGVDQRFTLPDERADALAAFGDDAYADIWTKAAALLHSIVNNHPLVDGNKRLGWLATAVFLELNDASVSTASNEDVFELVMAVASSDMMVEEIAATLLRFH